MTIYIHIYYYSHSHSQVTYVAYCHLFTNSAAYDEEKELGCRQSEIQAALQDTQYCFYIW